jgi:hypothetical protein
MQYAKAKFWTLLANEISSLTEGNRAVDKRIHSALGLTDTTPVYPYTNNLQWSLKLIPDGHWCVLTIKPGDKALCHVGMADELLARHDTPALAVCLAGARARI